MFNTFKDLFQKSITATKDGVFYLKLRKYVLRKIGVETPAKFKGGDWYQGEIAEDYESKRMKQHWWHEENRILEKFLTLVPKGIKVLDVPVGTARFLPIYKQNQMSMTGIDISSDMLDQAQKLQGDLLNGCQLDIGDATNLPYADNSFELVVCFRLLDGHLYFKDVNKAIEEFCRVSQKYLIFELGSVPQTQADSKLTLKNLKKDQPIDSKLSELERKKLIKMNGLTILISESACREDGTPHMNIYLCEKLIENSL